MTDLIERLRWSGQDAMTKHLSLGMAKLHAEAAAEIERLTVDLAAMKKLALSYDDDNDKYRAENERLRAVLKRIEVYATSKDDAKGMAAKALLDLVTPAPPAGPEG